MGREVQSSGRLRRGSPQGLLPRMEGARGLGGAGTGSVCQYWHVGAEQQVFLLSLSESI